MSKERTRVLRKPYARCCIESAIAFGFIAEICRVSLISCFLHDGKSFSCTDVFGTCTIAAVGSPHRSRMPHFGRRSGVVQ